MILWTLSSCVLLALSPAVLAVMEIDANCNTTQPEGPDLPTIQDKIIDIYTHIPGIGDIIGIGKDVIDIFGAVGNKESQFGTQWKNCIMGWIDGKIDEKAHKEILTQLAIMAAKMNRTIMPSIQDEYISQYNFNEINRDLHDLHNAADQIRIKISGITKDQQAFLFAYNSALAIDLVASKLLIQKLNETIFDPRYKSLVLKDIADGIIGRMYEIEAELNTLDDGLKDFKDGEWGIHSETSGHCHDNWGGWNYNDYTCRIKDPTGWTGAEVWCKTCPPGWGTCLIGDLCPNRKSPKWCDYDWCKTKLAEQIAKKEHTQKNVKELINGMKTSVGTARKYFDGLANPKTMELTEGTYCNSGCHNSEYHANCIKDCLLVPNEG